ncbi:hypothetical protein [Paenibacillus swuensis]|nr:hypothetical protein [Paenibacillus swuensis]
MLLVIIGLSITTVTFACSCVQLTPQESFDQSAAVFSGKLISQEQVNTAEIKPIGISQRDRNVFQVERVWKGAKQTQFVVYDNGAEESCGMDFTTGETYLVYAHENEKYLYTSYCNLTKPLARASDDMVILGQGSEPTTPVNFSKGNGWGNAIIGIGAATVLASAGLLFYIIRRNRRH